MYKIAILGCENSHADAFMKLISNGEYPQIEVCGLYSNEPEAVTKLCEKYKVHKMNTVDEFVGQVDGIMITARHGDNHYSYAKPYLSTHIPMFIDKPITISPEESVRFMREAQSNGVRLCGGSVCGCLDDTKELQRVVKEKTVGDIIGGTVVSPLHINSEYGGFHFYAQHLVQIMTTIFGPDIKKVKAVRTGNNVSYMAEYDQYCVEGIYLDGGSYYYGAAYGNKSTKESVIHLTPGCFKEEMDDMLRLLEGEPMAQSYQEFIQPVFIMDAIKQSYESGKTIPVPFPKTEEESS